MQFEKQLCCVHDVCHAVHECNMSSSEQHCAETICTSEDTHLAWMLQALLLLLQVLAQLLEAVPQVHPLLLLAAALRQGVVAPPVAAAPLLLLLLLPAVGPGVPPALLLLLLLLLQEVALPLLLGVPCALDAGAQGALLLLLLG
jgi:hypothetical protein